MEDAEEIYAAMAIPFHVSVFNESLMTGFSRCFRQMAKSRPASKPQKLMLGDLREALRTGRNGAAARSGKDLEFCPEAPQLDCPRWCCSSYRHPRDLGWPGLLGSRPSGSRTRDALLASSSESESGWRLVRSAQRLRCTQPTLGKPSTTSLNGSSLGTARTQIAVEDWIASFPEKWPDWERRARNAHAYARHEYASLELTPARDRDRTLGANLGSEGRAGGAMSHRQPDRADTRLSLSKKSDRPDRAGGTVDPPA